MTILNIVSKVDFEKEIKNTNVIIDFYADWCGPCKLLGKQLELVNEEKGKDVRILKINVDNNPEIVEIFSLKSVPTIIFIEKGMVYNQISGYRQKGEIISLLKK